MARQEIKSGINPAAQAPVMQAVRGPVSAGGVGNPMRITPPAVDAVWGQLAAWGSKEIKSAAKARYEAQMLDGAIASQQGRTMDEIDPGDQEWALEGYRTMDAATASAALQAAQMEAIAQGDDALDPDAYRAKLTMQYEEVLNGRDEVTQDMIRRQVAEQFPQLVAQQAASHLKYKEAKTYESLVNSVNVVATDPAQVDTLIAFATGGAGSAGLSPERRKSAVIDGIIRSYELGNPSAHLALEKAGALTDMTAQEISRLRSAQEAWEARARNTYSPQRLQQENTFWQNVEDGDITDPYEITRQYVAMQAEHDFVVTQDEARQVFTAGEQAAYNNAEAVRMEMQTAKLNGDFAGVANLSINHARAAANTPKRGQVFQHNSTLEFQMGPNRPNAPDESITSLIGRAANDVLGAGARVIVTSGTENEGDQYGSGRHKTGKAADVAFVRPNGTTVTANDPEYPALARAAARLGALGVGFGSEYMGGDHMHIDLVDPASVGGAHVWSSGAKAIEGELVGIMQSLPDSPPTGINVDPQRWSALVTQFEGDTELAAVALSTDTATALAWAAGGRDMSKLPGNAAQFVTNFGRQLSGANYQTSAQRAAKAQQQYEVVAERVAIDTYAQAAPLKAEAKRQLGVDGDVQAYLAEIRRIDTIWKVPQTVAGVNAEVSAIDKHYADQARIAEENLKAHQQSIRDNAEAAKQRSDTNQDFQKEQASIAKAAAADKTKANLELFQTQTGIASELMRKAIDAAGKLPVEQQVAAVQLAANEYKSNLSQLAAGAGLTPAEANLSQVNDKATAEVRRGLEAADKARVKGVLQDNALATGTVGTLSTADQDALWAKVSKEIQTTAQQAVRRGEDTPEQMQDFIEQRTLDYYAEAGAVPPTIRKIASSILTGQLVDEKGVPNQKVVDATMEYFRLRNTNSVAASTYFDPAAAAVAESLLSVTGGNPGLMPDAIKAAWQQGLDPKKPPPDFMEQRAVRVGLATALEPYWTSGSMLVPGLSSALYPSDFSMVGTDPDNSVMLSDAAQGLHKTMLEAAVHNIVTANPRVEPKTVVAYAARLVNQSNMVFNGEFIVNPFKGDLYAQTFGTQQADKYRIDPNSLQTALKAFVASQEFADRYTGGVRPVPALGVTDLVLEAARSGLQMVAPAIAPDMDRVVAAGLSGQPAVTVTMAGEGKVALDFRTDTTGQGLTVIVPLADVGAFYLGAEKKRRGQ